MTVWTKAGDSNSLSLVGVCEPVWCVNTVVNCVREVKGACGSLVKVRSTEPNEDS